MVVIEASDRARKGVQMTGKQGAAEWLRGIAQRKCNCHEIVRMFGFACGESPCTECIPRLVGAIADRIDAEQALPEGIKWPRFDDGELVKAGDEVEYGEETMRVRSVTFVANGWSLRCERRGVDGVLYGSYGERVKRSAPKVLDANGVPIKVGDTVWATYDGRKYVVKAVCSDGSLNPEMVTDDGCMVKYVEGGWDFAKKVTHERPDSWERLSNDAKMGAVTYADRILGVDTRETTTEEDYEAFARDIVRRAKALAKADSEARGVE